MLTQPVYRVIRSDGKVETMSTIPKKAPPIQSTIGTTMKKPTKITYKDPSPINHKGFFKPGFISGVMIGKSGCGKTRLLTEILPMVSDKIKTVIIATVVHGNKIHKTITDFFERRGTPSKIVNTVEELDDIITRCQGKGMISHEGNNGLIVFDDFSFKPNDDYVKFMAHAYTRLRNQGWHFITLCQYPTMLPPVIRNNTTFKILFNNASKSAMEGFNKDIRDRIGAGSRDEVISTLNEYIRRVPYSYVLQQEPPFTISAGKLLNIKKVVVDNDVSIPTMAELKKEMGVSSTEELKKKSEKMQKEIGNTAEELSDDESTSSDDESY